MATESTEAQKTRKVTIKAGPENKSTQIIISYFSNLLFVIITQTGEVGSYVMSEASTMDARTLLGDRTDLLPTVYANEIVSWLHFSQNLYRL